MSEKKNSGDDAGNRTPVADLASIKILVVDDDRKILEVLSEFLGDKGYAVSTASSGEEAIEKFKSDPSHVAIVDFKMQDMDGLTAIEKLVEINPSVVTIFMTGFPTLDSSIKALRLGAADYLLKPFKLVEVDLAVRKAMKDSRLKNELIRLRERLSRLEGSVSKNRDNIKINKKIKVMSETTGFTTRYLDTPPDSLGDREKT